MSWLFSQALVEEFSADTSSDGEPFAQLNVMPTQHKFWLKGKTMEFCDLSRFGLTSQLLTESHGEELLTSYLAGFHAKTSAVQEKVLASMANEAGSGITKHGLLTKYDQNSHSWKTAQCSLLEDSESFSETWPRWGLMQDGGCWALDTPASLTSVTVSGSSLPTPSGVNGGNNNTMGRVDEWGGSSNPLRGTVIGSMCLPEFEEMVMGWPVQWTALTPFETDKFQEWSLEHGRL